ncbi:MAG: hypothetical protein PHH17_01375 [Candidatus Pacebacteria bacterium]|jgi:hypothetical protein|nr:hypothetical protein [Candidatus Paceibacterota bacterium]MDD3072529.1 hypothetical protein [Candidatus Paceibacterota bacterium]MDD3728975.1 hypothetical protein [Candidatus Paceibacterota bacterium]MDD4201647.1 hypothetical protein [Candidatus Paceibacterota bacterium]MDD4467054.1 hypothetical protein [Candidatus Paceibacterota bacterium]
MVTIFIKYLEWHYVDKVLEILRLYKIYLVSYFKYFSISILIKTFFSPWKRISQGYGRGIDFQRFAEAFVFNTMSRVAGAVIRTFFLIIGIFFELLIFTIGFLILIFWLASPLLFLIGIYWSIYFLTL